VEKCGSALFSTVSTSNALCGPGSCNAGRLNIAHSKAMLKQSNTLYSWAQKQNGEHSPKNLKLGENYRLRHKTGPPSRNNIAEWAAEPLSGYRCILIVSQLTPKVCIAIFLWLYSQLSKLPVLN